MTDVVIRLRDLGHDGGLVALKSGSLQVLPLSIVVDDPLVTTKGIALDASEDVVLPLMPGAYVFFFEHVWGLDTFTFLVPDTGTVTLAELIANHQVDPETLEPLEGEDLLSAREVLELATAAKDAAEEAAELLLNQKGEPNGVAELDGDGKILASRLPSITLIATYVVDSEEDMLALDAQQGDVAIRTDTSQTFILGIDGDAAEVEDWKELLTVPDGIISIAGITTATVTASALKAALGITAGDIVKTSSGTNGRVIGGTLAQGAAFGELAYSSAATPGSLASRDSNGRTQVAAPAADADVANKKYVDDLAVPKVTDVNRVYVTDSSGAQTTYLLTSGGATPLTMVRRDGNGRMKAADPSVSDDVATKFSSELTGDRSIASALTGVSGTLNLSSYTRPRTIRISLTGNVTGITLPTPSSTESYSLTLVFVQDSTGGRTVTWGTSIKGQGGIKPVLSTAGYSTDIVTLFWSGTEWVAMLAAQGVW